MKNYILPLLIFSAVLSACKKDKPEPDDTDPYASQKVQVKQTYAQLAYAVYDDAYVSTLKLQTAIEAFIANPTSTGFDECKQKWLDAREVYGLTETFRFADGPIDNETDGPEGLINAWPMDEAYVDYVIGNPTSGIINNTTSYPNISKTTLFSANENGGEENISLGYHAVEFLLWGQDTSANSAGMRPYTDYLTTGGTASNQDRRKQYLSLATEILVDALKQVRDAWDPATTNSYSETFVALSNETALHRIFNSLKVLSGTELSGERMYTAYDNMDQEDEHSCFSDNTHRDIYLNAKGMENLYLGTYKTSNGIVISGYALKDLVALYSADKNQAVVDYLASSLTKISAMYIPFDQAIVLPAERPKVLDAITELQTLELKIKDAAAAVGVQLQ
ncbi:MAG: hypothetical protein KDD36_13390 [Flavobacteriales bacterium]|nr:hypothetical protein [Flavobacteriales bacterium]